MCIGGEKEVSDADIMMFAWHNHQDSIFYHN